MSVLALPMAPAGSVQEQVTQQYAYLLQMAQQLNLALGQLEGMGGGGTGFTSAARQAAGRTGSSGREKADEQYETLRSMIIKTAARVEKTTQELTAQLKENYVAASFYGDVAVSGSLKLNGVAVEEKLFPVGSVRLTATADAPELPGTWQQVQAGLSGVYAWRRVT